MKNRKANRFQDHDYSRKGYYFVTICTLKHARCFGEITNERMRLNAIGMIAHLHWREIPKHFSNTSLDEFIVMPNQIHGVVIIGDENHSARDAYMCGTTPRRGRHLQSKQQNIDRSKMYLSKIIQGFKSSVTRTVGKRWSKHALGWQRSFYDHVIRDDANLNRVREYIQNNPQKWAFDKYNPEYRSRNPTL